MKSLELIRNFLTTRQGVEATRVVPDATLADLGVDSLMMLELMFECEDQLGVKLPEDLTSPKTVGEMAALMDGLLAGQTG
ncbi:acyl carrier protein [Thiobacillus sedimenti]|uniref:Phosphopantetheine-binding protein n=1 Tax=Thiobacillus sedimenti TaxID=3110231 RepID=A0ABZ1CJ93_9PROT|nr:phosphopantetheine-binding protein [Thiobacillus sp. SCUT-2]WRS39140.1 phosphopantetheine-binding protein [Thiobacillus sp. SCUT-2]